MMRVIHVIPSIDREAGGPTTALIGLTAAQMRAGMQVTVLTTYRSPADLDLGTGLEEQNVQVHMLGPVRGKVGWHRDLKSLVGQRVGEADVVHIHAVWESVLHHAAVAARRLGIPYLIRPCGMLDPWSLAQSRLPKVVMMAWRVKRNLRGAAAIHYTTTAEQEASAGLGLTPKTIVEPNGVELREFTQLPAAGTFRGRYPQIGNKPLLIFLGRIHPGKGLEHLIPALAQAKVDEAMLAVVGPDSENYRAKMESLIRVHGLKDRVIFTGLLGGADRIAALADADLFCLPSDHENFGMSVVEALAAGTPVLVSDQVAIWREIVEAGVGGASAASAPSVAVELRRWLGDASLRAAAAEKARAFVWARYDWDSIAGRWKNHYQEILAGRSGQAVTRICAV